MSESAKQHHTKIINCSINDIISMCDEFIDKNIITIIKYCDGTLSDKKNLEPIISDIEIFNVLMICHPCIREFYNQYKKHFSKEKTKSDINTIDKFYHLPLKTKLNLAYWLQENTQISNKVISIILSTNCTKSINNINSKFNPISENIISPNIIKLWETLGDRYRGTEFNNLKVYLKRIKNISFLKIDNPEIVKTYNFVKKNYNNLKNFSKIKHFVDKFENEKYQALILEDIKEIKKIISEEDITEERFSTIQEKIDDLSTNCTKLNIFSETRADLRKQLDLTANKLELKKEETKQKLLYELELQKQKECDEFVNQYMADIEEYYSNENILLADMSKYEKTFQMLSSSQYKRLYSPYITNFLYNFERTHAIHKVAIDIKQVVEEREIKSVLHFTRVSNLPSIIKDNILSRKQLDYLEIKYDFNDEYRIDGFNNAICCSLSFPNYQLFYRFRMIYPDTKWIVIKLKPKIIWEKNCLFFKNNAASAEEFNNNMKQEYNRHNLQSLFEEIENFHTREEMRLPERYPTNPQSEVLFFNMIETTYIDTIYCENEVMKEELSKLYPQIKFEYDKRLFEQRIDWKYWKKDGD